MLELKRIVKDYHAGDTRVRALAGVSLRFRRNEFVSILGPSGCGKTTLLNIIGGLDQYTSGDLVIGGVSTKEYTDADWDTYRNHSIGFVFQSYNLIPHQTVLANVELALTLSGISPTERRTRAIRALRDVGLASQINKKPSQLSGGQMQRVAIARALVNNPDIILADEPTGALDTTTSVQIMEILKKISRRKLIIMVTHNPELAKEYSSRIISMVDGRVTNDSNPCWAASDFASGAKETKKKKKKPLRSLFSLTSSDVDKYGLAGTGIVSPRAGKKKKSMSFWTALSLSFNNLLTKKARTFMVSFAGSIGIIGIALILSVSTGVNNYINDVQRDTLASYPIQLMAETTDLSSIITSMMQTSEEKENNRPLDKIYESTIIVDLMNSLNNADTNKNDLTAFKKHLESTEAFKEYLTAIQYQYDFNWSVLVEDADGNVVKSDVMELINAIYGGNMNDSAAGSMMGMGGMGSSMMGGFNVWEEMLPGVGEGETINSLIKEEYDLIYGEWPTEANEVVLVVNKQNEISDLALYALGLRTEKEIMEALIAAGKGETVDTSQAKSWTYEELCDMDFRLFLQSECYQKQLDGTYTNISNTDTGLSYLFDNPKLGVDLKISGIIRPGEDTSSAILSGTIAYTSELTKYAIEKTAESELIQAQLATPEIDVLTGKPFKTENTVDLTPAEKKEAVIAAMAQMDEKTKLAFFMQLIATPTEDQITQAFDAQVAQFGGLRPFAIFALQTQGMSAEEAQAAIANIDDDMLRYTFYQSFKETYTQQYAQQMQAMLQGMTPEQMLAMMNQKLTELTDNEFAALYDEFLDNYSDSTYEKNLALLGNVSLDSPSAINLYCDTFENKDRIAELITEYNNGVEEEKQINYTDYVALLMSSVTTIVDAITYVLIAFVAISLVVSSIMIGIITYISVLERTKEIGILRAIGASKKDIRRVFNAETLIVGFVAGALGIGITLGLNVVINIILFNLTGLANLQATLPTTAAFLLVGISMALTLIAGIFPSGFAAKRNPVEALRTE
ncbi:MAG: ABC transporter ATP-binding protein/permease [Clostridia bacterium]|nr:ABC transporter ATP-binding protein/permease [Clostridia bacterium]